MVGDTLRYVWWVLLGCTRVLGAERKYVVGAASRYVRWVLLGCTCFGC